MFVGFKRLKIQPFKTNADGSVVPDGKLITIEGNPNKGATVQAEISGMSKDTKVISGSNIAYYISRKGVKEPKVEFEMLDIQQADETRILGREETENGVQLTGQNTEAPYCGIVMESNDGQGNTAVVGMFYGVFSHDSDTLKTEEVGEDFTPENEKYTFTASANPDNDATFGGQYMAKYAGTNQAAIEEINKRVLRTSASATTVTQPTGD